MADKKLADVNRGEVVYEESFTARVNKEGDTEEVILRGADSSHSLVLWPKGAKRNKFQSDHPTGYTIIVIKNPLPEPDEHQGQDSKEPAATTQPATK